MKISKITLLLFLGISLIFQSCEKQEILDGISNETDNQNTINEVVVPDTKNFVYYIDDIKVSKTEFDASNKKGEETFLIRKGMKEDKGENASYQMFLYTSEAGYINYGERNNINLKAQLEFEKHMRAYAETSGAIAEYEKTGTVPQSYLNYESSYYKKVSGGNNKSFLVQFNKGHNNTGGSVVMIETFAVMPFTRNNKESSVTFIGLYDVVTIFDKVFYMDRIKTIQDVGLDCYNLYGSADNTTSSAIKAW